MESPSLVRLRHEVLEGISIQGVYDADFLSFANANLARAQVNEARAAGGWESGRTQGPQPAKP